ncbi:ABC transporter permease subunit [Haloarchaeobius amylolyticus]|uniref:ABC transporter permease subunit n=1 Tax=Haloarchaeobius amylolyticus TaxID=1198296 RepID=UPI00226EBC30|nr:ABC transporter permease subunit [Haloarchaeobius amylolyticus]
MRSDEQVTMVPDTESGEDAAPPGGPRPLTRDEPDAVPVGTRIHNLLTRRTVSRRALVAGASLLSALLAAFFVLRRGPLSPIDTIYFGYPESREVVQQTTRTLGMETPILAHLVEYLAQLLVLEFPHSYVLQTDPAPASTWSVVATHVGPTLWLAFWGFTAGTLAAGTLALLAGRRPGSLLDRALGVIARTTRATPTFFVAAVALVVASPELADGGFAREPAFSLDFYRSAGETPLVLAERTLVVLPFQFSLDAFVGALTGVAVPAAVVALACFGCQLPTWRRVVNETSQETFVTAAKTRGLPATTLVGRHLAPVVLARVSRSLDRFLVVLLGSVLVVEVLFGVHGLADVFFQAALQGDLPLTEGLFVLLTATVVGVRFAADVVADVVPLPTRSRTPR